jgi:hypothetical protein
LTPKTPASVVSFSFFSLAIRPLPLPLKLGRYRAIPERDVFYVAASHSLHSD